MKRFLTVHAVERKDLGDHHEDRQMNGPFLRHEARELRVHDYAYRLVDSWQGHLLQDAGHKDDDVHKMTDQRAADHAHLYSGRKNKRM